MNLPTITEALARLEANPAGAAEYEAAMRREAPGKSRREAVQATLDAFAAKRRENEAMRAKLSATRQRIAALEKAKGAQATLKAELSAARGKLATAQAKAGRRAPASKPAPAETAAQKFQRLQRTNPTQARDFWNEHRLEILNHNKTHQ